MDGTRDHKDGMSGTADGNPANGTAVRATPAPLHPRWLILPEVLLVVLGVLALVVLLVFAADRQDRIAGGQSQRIATSLLSMERDSLEKTVSDYAWWNDTVKSLAAVPHGGWAENLLGPALHTQFDINDALLLDETGAVLFALSDGKQSDPGLYARYGAPLAALVQQAQNRAGAAPSPGGERPIALSGLVTVPDGRGGVSLTLAAVSPLFVTVPGSDGAGMPGRLMLVFIRHVDDAALNRIERLFGLRALAYHPDRTVPAGAAFLSLSAPDGTGLGHLTWVPDQPGRTLLRRVAVPLAAVLVIMAGLGVLAVRRAFGAAAAVQRAAALLRDANEGLELSHRRFRDFAEASSDWFWETGPDHTYTYVSERLEALLKCSPRSVFGSSLMDLGRLVEDADTWAEFRADILAGRAFRDLEVQVDGHDGALLVLRLSGQPVLGADGQLLGYRGTGIDVTAETMAMMDARFMQVVVHDALDSISEGFVLFNADGRLLFCNDRYRQAYPTIADVLVPGTTFDEILRMAAVRGGYQGSEQDMVQWIQARKNRHLEHEAPVDKHLSDGRWYRISEHATGSGGIVKILMDITELKDREQELAGQTARLKATLESISQGICMFDRNGALAAWNDDFPRLLGLPADFARFGRPLEDLAVYIRAEAPPLAVAFQSDATASTPMVPAARWEVEPLRVGERFLEVRRSPIPGGGFVATITDVTDRYRFEAVLRDLAQSVSHGGGEEFFRKLVLALARALDVEIAVVAAATGEPGTVRMLALTVDGEIQPPAAVSLAGTPAEQIMGRAPRVFPSGVFRHFPDDPLVVGLKVESYCGAPLFDSAGRPLGVIAVMSRRPNLDLLSAQSLLDVFGARAAAELERVNTVTALKESEHRYRQLVEMAPYGIVIWYRSAIHFANAAAAGILGMTGAGVMEGESLARFMEDGAVVEAQLARAADGQHQRLEAEVIRPSGERRHVEVEAYPAVYQGGAAVLVVMNDITERRRAEHELQRSQKMEAVGRMAGGIAHEFNNMLTAIGGFARLAERSPGDANRVLSCVREIAKASDRAAALTSQLLDFSRRRVSEETEVVGLADLVRDLRVFLKPLITSNVALEVDIRDPGAYAVANPVTLNQALLNLAINARDAMPNGGRLVVSLDVVTPPPVFFERYEYLKKGRYALLRVTDTGFGIPEEIRDRIWEPFFTTKEPGKGTGLGLWMVYGTARQAGGVVEVMSEPGQGAVFSLYLPAVDPPKPQAEGVENVGLPEGETAWVLLVDDEESVRSFLRLTLEEAGCEVVEAADGVEALKCFMDSGGLFDIVISDISMPRMSGPELARALEEHNPELRILFLTGYASRDMAEGLTARPGTQILMKPVTPEKLLAAVRELIAA